jgi:hypothetical protein
LANPGLKLKAFSIDNGGVRCRQLIDRITKAQQSASR